MSLHCSAKVERYAEKRRRGKEEAKEVRENWEKRCENGIEG
jgi:hypothetical protein